MRLGRCFSWDFFLKSHTGIDERPRGDAMTTPAVEKTAGVFLFKFKDLPTEPLCRFWMLQGSARNHLHGMSLRCLANMRVLKVFR